MEIKSKINNFLRWSEKYAQTDMIYLAKGGFWLTMGHIISTLASFLLAIAFANLLSKETYGTYTYVISLAGILAIFTLPGMNTAIIQAVARGYEGSFLPALKTKLRWGILGGIVSLGAAGYYFLNNNPTLTICFLISAAFLPLMDSFLIYEAFWTGKKQFKIQTKYRIITQILAVSTLIVTLLLTKNLFLILLVYFLSHTGLNFIFLQITLRKSSLNKEQDSKTISYGKHLSLMGGISKISSELDKILLWYFLGPAQVAIYSFATILPIKIKDLLKTIGILALPKFSQRSKEELKSILVKKILKLYLAIVPITTLYIILAPFIFKIFFSQYLDSVIYSQVFILSLLLFPRVLPDTALTAQMKKKELYIARFLPPLIKIVLLLILLPLYGIWGAVSAVLIAEASSFGLLLFLFRRI